MAKETTSGLDSNLTDTNDNENLSNSSPTGASYIEFNKTQTAITVGLATLLAGYGLHKWKHNLTVTVLGCLAVAWGSFYADTYIQSKFKG